MGKAIDISGQTFNRLTAISMIGKNKHNQIIWLCLCNCGNEAEVTTRDLRSGHTKSCGCLQKEKVTKHGLRNSKLYGVHKAMKQRCNNENNQSYQNYGGRGIKVCSEWLGKDGFVNFFNWSVESGYKEGLTLERINVDGDYEPSNCTWATYKTQLNNTRRNRYIEINNEIKTLSRWADESGLSRKVIADRLNRGWNKEDVLKPLTK